MVFFVCGCAIVICVSLSSVFEFPGRCSTLEMPSVSCCHFKTRIFMSHRCAQRILYNSMLHSSRLVAQGLRSLIVFASKGLPYTLSYSTSHCVLHLKGCSAHWSGSQVVSSCFASYCKGCSVQCCGHFMPLALFTEG